jgi:hypothetical protein
MNAFIPLASMTTREVPLSLYVVERDSLKKRRAEIMAELVDRVFAQQSEQPSVSPTTP